MWTVSQGFMGLMAGSPEFQALDPATGGTFRSRRDTEGGEAAVPHLPPLALAAAVRNLCRVPRASRQFLLSSLASPPLYSSHVFRSSAESDLGI